MLSPEKFLENFKANGIGMISGVPDSLLSELNKAADALFEGKNKFLAVNEGSAVAHAAGYYLATGKIALIYMQNSGIGNAINPLLSLVDPEVFGIPAILLIGWRGEPGVPDEPQHIKQGRVTESLLTAMEIPYFIINGMDNDYLIPEKAVKTALDIKGPVAILVRKNTFMPASINKPMSSGGDQQSLIREKVVGCILDSIPPNSLVISTTGHISREIYEQRLVKGAPADCDFLTVGSMGHVSQIALAIAQSSPSKFIVCIDGDGSVLMHMGGLATVGVRNPKNMLHIVLNNGAHGSVGGQSTDALNINLNLIAKSCGYVVGESPIKEYEEINKAIKEMVSINSVGFLEIVVGTFARSDLGRPKISPRENKKSFMRLLQVSK